VVKLLYALRSALAGLRASPFVHAVAVLTIAVALFSVGLAQLGVRALGGLLDDWGAEVEVTLYLSEKTTEAEAGVLADGLRQKDQAEVRFVSPEQALVRLQGELGEAGKVLADLPRSPLPPSLEVRPPRATRAQLAAYAERWGKLPGVESVEYGREWVDRLERLGRAARAAALVLLLVVLGSAVVVIAATLQLAIYARRQEIEIQKLVGASNAFVKAPFLIEGLVQGLLGGLLAVGGLLALLGYLLPRFAEALGFLPWTGKATAILGVSSIASLLGAGVALGLVGSLLAVRRFLRI
jgi:cell division transport system permease protein